MHNFVKMKSINIKLDTIVSEVIPGLCTKFGQKRTIGGAINIEKPSDAKVDRICTKFGELSLEALPRPGVEFRDVWSQWAWFITTQKFSKVNAFWPITPTPYVAHSKTLYPWIP